jgi:UDP-N-acetylglucosamine 2-epimerase (non-hydrolysing)
MNLTLIAGARPNFMKIAPVIHAIKSVQQNGKNIDYRLVHTGQHYDQKMSDTFFTELNIPAPDANLGCVSLCVIILNVRKPVPLVPMN